MNNYNGFYIHADSLTDITIKVVGTNLLETGNQSGGIYGFKNLVITGTSSSDTLTVKETSYSEAINVFMGNLEVENITLNVITTDINSGGKFTWGIHGGNTVISGTGQLTVTVDRQTTADSVSVK